jgi:8-oxo-dGTP diphosphatase
MQPDRMKRYVAGFLFRFDLILEEFQVALIRKLKPEWQKGRLNAIGGKIEDGETPFEAMVREFREEAGAVVTDWRYFCGLRGLDWEVYFFASHSGVEVETQEEEKIDWYDVDRIRWEGPMPNLLWLVPMALDKDQVSAVVTDLAPQAA